MFFLCLRTRYVFLKAFSIVLVSILVWGPEFSFASYSSIATHQSGFTLEQLNNYKDHDNRIKRIVDIVFADMPEQHKLSWRMLLLGTIATETNFLDRYSGRSINGNGPYQIIGDTAYGIVHRYITYPLSGSRSIAKRKSLIPLFEEATRGRISWDDIYGMNKEQLRQLCVADYDFAALMSLLVYKEAFNRSNIVEILPEPKHLARLWKKHYNTSLGVGTEKRFIERFMCVYPYLT
jgi:hypothetical protein